MGEKPRESSEKVRDDLEEGEGATDDEDSDTGG